MAYRADILLGRIIKSFGFDGAVSVKLERTFDRKIFEMESVFLESEGKPVPFIVSSCEVIDNSLIRLIFEGYNSLEKINEFIGCRVFLTSSGEADVKENDLNLLRDYQIISTDNNLLGTVHGIIENPGQILLNIHTSLNKEILVPLHKDFIVKVDNKKKIITMDLPEGLTEINE
jgi:16S rRNA processing protein RimM